MRNSIGLLLIIFLGLTACEKENELLNAEENQILKEALINDKKITICLYDEKKDSWHTISVNKHAAPAFLRKGDVVIDEDGDGFALFNECGIMNENGIDCDDNNDTVFPGAEEICGDGIDNNCDGNIDECTYIPDDNFEQALINRGFDSGPLDDYVVTEKISSVTTLNFENCHITDLTGIEDFKALTNLDCRYNKLTNLDISKNTALRRLICYSNQLQSLDLSTNANLIYLDCQYNQLTNLDLTNNIESLQSLYCQNNQLTTLIIPDNSSLHILKCYKNQLSSLDMSNNSALQYLFCGNNPLTSLDVSNNSALILLNCFNNQLVSLDISTTKIESLLTVQNPNLSCIRISFIPDYYRIDSWTELSTSC